MQSSVQWEHGVTPVTPPPRAVFDVSEPHKTTYDFDYLIPVYWRKIVPNETLTVKPSVWARLATLNHPIMDNCYHRWDAFWIPEKQIWTNARKHRGEQIDPGDSIDYTQPIMNATATTGYGELSLFDYFGLPTKKPDYEHNANPIRCYPQVWNFWYRDQNLQDSLTVDNGDGPDTTTDTNLQKRNKIFDGVTSGLIAPQKNNDGAITLPLGTSAPIHVPDANTISVYADDAASYRNLYDGTAGTNNISTDAGGVSSDQAYANLTDAASASVIAVRTALQMQKIVELDARIGSRLHEVIYGTFGIVLDNMESYMPEYLAGGRIDFDINSVPSTYDDGTNDTKGDLGAVSTAYGEGQSFTKTFTEWGYVLILASAHADITYQQGLHRFWSESTRYDSLYPQLQMVGDEPMYNIEIVCENPVTDTGSTGTPDNERVFNYRERYGYYKYGQKKITGLFRSNCTSSLEAWHLSEEFSAGVAFNSTFIQSNTPMDRAIKVPSEPHIIADWYFEARTALPMQLYSIPGLGTRL